MNSVPLSQNKILFSHRASRSSEPASQGCPVSGGQKIRGPIFFSKLGLSDPSFIRSRFYSARAGCQQSYQTFQPVLLSTPTTLPNSKRPSTTLYLFLQIFFEASGSRPNLAKNFFQNYFRAPLRASEFRISQRSSRVAQPGISKEQGCEQ
jgi:hypothetical protein